MPVGIRICHARSGYDAGARRVACADVLGALAERSADYQTMQGYVSGWVVVRGEYGASGKNDRRTAMRKKTGKVTGFRFGSIVR